MIDEIKTAICLLMVLEGILPFISPSIWKKVIQKAIKQNDQLIRLNAFLIMLVGSGFLYIIRN